jgi:hypothetical protein
MTLRELPKVGDLAATPDVFKRLAGDGGSGLSFRCASGRSLERIGGLNMGHAGGSHRRLDTQAARQIGNSAV